MLKIYTGKRTDDLLAASLLGGVLKLTGKRCELFYIDDRDKTEKCRIFSELDEMDSVCTIGLSFSCLDDMDVEKIKQHRFDSRISAIWDNHAVTCRCEKQAGKLMFVVPSVSLTQCIYDVLLALYSEDEKVMSFLKRVECVKELMKRYGSLRRDTELETLRRINSVGMIGESEKYCDLFMSDPCKIFEVINSPEVNSYVKKQERRFEKFRRGESFLSDQIGIFYLRKSDGDVSVWDADLNSFLPEYFLKKRAVIIYVVTGKKIYIRTTLHDMDRIANKLFCRLKAAGVMSKVHKESKTRADLEMNRKLTKEQVIKIIKGEEDK